MRGLLFSGGGILQILISVFCVLLCLTVHEVAHGFAAYKLGDDTAKNMGRLTLNPLPHIDIFGGLALLFFGFGWAKPVMVDPRNFTRRISMRNGMAITSFAGPLSNLIFAFLVMLIAMILNGFDVIRLDFVRGFNAMVAVDASIIESTLTAMFMTLIGMNLGLAVFNLIPVPPLDGSKILSAWLPDRTLFRYMQFERYGFFVLILMLNLPIFRNFLGQIMNAVWNFNIWIIGLIPFL